MDILTKRLQDITNDINIPWNKFEGKTILITGASGLLGSVFSKGLITRISEYSDSKVILLSRSLNKLTTVFSNYIDHKNVVFITDLNDPKIPKVDYVVHFASPTNSSEFSNSPVEVMTDISNFTAKILKFSHENHAKVLYISSMEVYGQVNHELVAETDIGFLDISSPRSSYPIAKRYSESLCFAWNKEYELDVKIARLTLTFGPGISKFDKRVFAQFAHSIILGIPIVLHTEGSTKRDYIHIADAVRALFYILLKDSEYISFNISNPETYLSIRELAQEFSTYGKTEVIIDKSQNHNQYAPTVKINLSTERLKSLGWTPMFGINEMVNDLVSYMKDQDNE